MTRAALAPADAAIDDGLRRVEQRFTRQLGSDLPAVMRLVRYAERYRGKMLRPVMVMLSGLAADPRFASGVSPGDVSDDHVTLAAVCEMIHMATLVHDDVLDEAQTRRRAQTVNRLHGNEAAVILGDYLIAAAYHLCSRLESQRAALLVGQASMTMCSGELLQLSHRDDLSIDEPTYFEIVERKTGALIALACRLGAERSGAAEGLCRRLETFGRRVGVAFQIQDDLLDLVASEASVGKSVGKDLEKGKLTLPMIHHLGAATPAERGRTLSLLVRPGRDEHEARAAREELGRILHDGGSIDYARRVARSLVDSAKQELGPLPESPARHSMLALADAVIDRTS